jgi:hypothetical protein
MNDTEEIKKLLSELIKSTESILAEKPFFFINEFDLQAYLYSKLIAMPELSSPFAIDRDSKTVDCFRVHCEYNRYEVKGEGLNCIGAYDLAILRKDNRAEKPFPTDTFSQKPVWVGFETKCQWNIGEKAVTSQLIDETNAFVKNVDGVERRPADYGVVFHVNIEKQKASNLVNIRKAIRDFQLQFKSNPPFVVYIEVSDRKEKPRKIAFDPEGNEF